MTKIQPSSAVVRETDSLYRGRPIVVELHCSYIRFRVKGLKSMQATVSIEGAFERALAGEARQAASDKLTEAGKVRKVSRGLLKTDRG